MGNNQRNISHLQHQQLCQQQQQQAQQHRNMTNRHMFNQQQQSIQHQHQAQLNNLPNFRNKCNANMNMMNGQNPFLAQRRMTMTTTTNPLGAKRSNMAGSVASSQSLSTFSLSKDLDNGSKQIIKTDHQNGMNLRKRRMVNDNQANIQN